LSSEDREDARFRPSSTTSKGSIEKVSKSFKGLEKAAAKLHKAAITHDAYAAELADAAGQDIPWWKWYTKAKLYYNIRKVNSKYKNLERQFLYEDGLDSRSWFKHVVFAPGLWTGYAGAVFPGLVESLDEKDYGNAERWVGIIEGLLVKAAVSLK